MKKKPKTDSPSDHAVVFYCYPKLFFSWPLIVIGPLFWFIAAPGEDPTAVSGRLEVLGWIYLAVVALVILAISVDL